MPPQPERVTQELPASSSGPAPLPLGSTPDLSWRQVAYHALSTALAMWTAVKVLAWLPECFTLIKLPAGGVTHDPWAWAPLVLDLGAAVAVASPVSFRSLLELARGLHLPKA